MAIDILRECIYGKPHMKEYDRKLDIVVALEQFHVHRNSRGVYIRLTADEGNGRELGMGVNL